MGGGLRRGMRTKSTTRTRKQLVVFFLGRPRAVAGKGEEGSEVRCAHVSRAGPLGGVAGVQAGEKGVGGEGGREGGREAVPLSLPASC